MAPPFAPSLTRAWIFVLTFVSAAFLAWSAHRTLGPLLGERLGPSALTLRVVPATTSDPQASPDLDVTIRGIIADGKRVRWDETVRAGTWIEGSMDIPELSHPRNEPPSSITFRAASAMGFAAPSNGKILLERDGKAVKEVDLSSTPTRFWQWEVVFDFGSPTAPRWTLWALLPVSVLLAILAILFRPWVLGRADRWIFFYAAALHALVWATQPIGSTRDTIGYVQGVEEWSHGAPGYFPPGTSIFIWLMGLVPFGGLGTKVALLQHAMFSFMVLWLYRLLRRSLTEGVAFLAGLVLASSWFVLFLPQAILSETLGAFGMAGALYFAARYRDGGSFLSAIKAGICAGCAGLARVIPLFTSILAFLCLHLLPPSWRGLWRVALLTAVSIAVMLAPLGWYWSKTGELRLTTSDGFHMFNRVVEAQRKLSEHGPSTRHLLQLLDSQDPRGRDVWEVFAMLDKKGLGYIEIRELFKKVSMEAILEAPGEFVAFTLDQAWRQYHQDPLDSFSLFGDTVKPVPGVECPPVVGFSSSAFRWGTSLMYVHRHTWEWLRWLGFAGMALFFLLPRCIYLLALSIVVVGYFLGTAAAAYVLPRYAGPAAPFVIALAAIPLDIAVRSLAGVLARVWPGPTTRGDGVSSLT